MEKTFEMGQTVYVVRRDKYGRPTDVVRFIFVTQVEHAAIVRYDCDQASESPENLLTQILLESAMEDSPDLWVFPLKDCYTNQEAAYRKIDVFLFTEGTDYELR